MKHILQFSVLIFGIFVNISLYAQAPTEQVPVDYKVIISPNPATERITFKVEEGTYKLTEIRIYNLIGKEVLQIPLKTGSGVYTADLATLLPGVYFCSIISERGIVIETRKLVRSNR